MKQMVIALRMILFFTILLGVIYPLSITLVSQVVMPEKSNGQLIQVNGEVRGSLLIGQNFEKNDYFWSRPSATGYNPQPSGGTNWGPTSADLKKLIKERRDKLMKSHNTSKEPPQDLLQTSASGLDPHISPSAAQYQVARVAQARQLPIESVEKLVKRHTNSPDFKLFGDAYVNVLELNIALDQLKQ